MNNSNNNRKFSRQELEQLVPDYLNGHTTSVENDAIEARISSDASFAQMVELEEQLLQSVRTSANERVVSPQFSTIADRLTKRPLWRRPEVAWPAVAACALIMMVGVGQWTHSNVAFNDFETLSTASVDYTDPTVRVIGGPGVEPEDIERYLESLGLVVVQQFSSLQVYDVQFTDDSTRERLIETLKEDKRFLSVEVVVGSAQ